MQKPSVCHCNAFSWVFVLILVEDRRVYQSLVQSRHVQIHVIEP